MSELPNSNEHHERKEILISAPERQETLPPPKSVEKKHEKDPALTLREVRTDVQEITQADKQPTARERLEAAEKVAKPVQSLNISRELKSITLSRELKSLQRKLPAPERAYSKVIHHPLVRTISETASSSVSRPSGLLGGGLVAFLGTSGYLYLARHVGFTYNYFIFVLLFIGGFFVGLILELLVYLATTSRRHSHDQ